MIRAYGDDPLPPVAILRGGTMNTVATSFGIRGEAPRCFRAHRQAQARAAFDSSTSALLRVGDAYGFIFGNGLIYNFLEAYYGTGTPLAARSAARIVAQGSASALVGGAFARRLYRRVQARASPSMARRGRARTSASIAAAVVEQIGLGFQPFYRLHDKPDAFADPRHPHRRAVGFISELPRIRAGQPCDATR